MQIDVHADREMIATVRRRREPRPWLQLISAVLTLAGEQAQMLHHSESPWASITFSGTRHAMRLQFDGDAAIEAAERFIAALPEHEFTISHKLVADATITAVEQTCLPDRRMIVEATLLLLEEG